MGTPKITVQCGRDCVAIWKDDVQIYCYYDHLELCLRYVVESLGGDFEIINTIKNGSLDWDSIDGVTLTEFRRMCAESKAECLREELKQARDLVKGLEATLEALGVDE